MFLCQNAGALELGYNSGQAKLLDTELQPRTVTLLQLLKIKVGHLAPHAFKPSTREAETGGSLNSRRAWFTESEDSKDDTEKREKQ